MSNSIHYQNNLGIITWSKGLLLFGALFTCLGAKAQTGPGGVGNSADTSSLKLWYRVDNGVSVTGATVNSWTISGIIALNKTFRDIVIYPVPAKDELLVEYPSSEKIIFQPSDELGREYTIHPVVYERGASIRTSTLPPGIYFLYITNGREQSYKRVVIQ